MRFRLIETKGRPPLDQAVQGYESFDRGVAKKFVLDPHGMLAA